MPFQKELSTNNVLNYGYSFSNLPIYGPPGSLHADLMREVVGVDVTKVDRRVGGKPILNMTFPYHPLNNPIYMQSNVK